MGQPLNAFSRSLRAIERDGSRGPHLAILLAAVLLLGWGVWFFAAPLRVYEVSDTARLEVDRSAYPVTTDVPGRVVSTRLELNRPVTAGEILVELDAIKARTELEEARSRYATTSPQLMRIRSELAARERAAVEESKAAEAALEEARAQYQEAASQAEYEAGQAERARRLRANGLISEAEMLRAKAEAERTRSVAKARELAIKRVELEARAKRTDREAEIRELQRDALDLERERDIALSSSKGLEHEMGRYVLRAPVEGRIGEALDLRVGSVLAGGERVGTIVRPGKLRVVALFRPEDALGRIRHGQPARIRFAGFSWSQYGSVPLLVDLVATELRDGRIRVELSVPDGHRIRIPLQHALPGTVEVEVERVTPAAVALRAAGRILATPDARARESAH